MPSMTDLNSRLNGLSTPTVAQGWQLTTLASSTAEEKMEIDLEIERLEGILGRDVHVWQKRLDEVNEELKGKTIAAVA
jgi:ATP-binding cassette subfamily D (ALD) long-chain fatty acid import protein